jgi:hypothetical protein
VADSKVCWDREAFVLYVSMDLLGMIGELREEWERLNDAILALEKLAHGNKRGRGRPPKSSQAESPYSAGAGARKAQKRVDQPVSHNAE